MRQRNLFERTFSDFPCIQMTKGRPNQALFDKNSINFARKKRYRKIVKKQKVNATPITVFFFFSFLFTAPRFFPFRPQLSALFLAVTNHLTSFTPIIGATCPTNHPSFFSLVPPSRGITVKHCCTNLSCNLTPVDIASQHVGVLVYIYMCVCAYTIIIRASTTFLPYGKPSCAVLLYLCYTNQKMKWLLTFPFFLLYVEQWNFLKQSTLIFSINTSLIIFKNYSFFNLHRYEINSLLKLFE